MRETAQARMQEGADAPQGGSAVSRLHTVIPSNHSMFHRTSIDITRSDYIDLSRILGSLGDIVHSPNGVRSYTDFRRKLGRKMNFLSKSSLPPTAP